MEQLTFDIGGDKRRRKGPKAHDLASRTLFAEEGQRFGHGVVIDPEVRIPPRGVRGARLICDCGRQYVARLQHLLSGHIKACGHLRGGFVDRVGRRYGKLLVIRHVETRPREHGGTETLWLCRCDCGNETTVEAGRLGHTVTCGCGRKKPRDENYPGRAARNRVLGTYKASARNRSLAFDLTDEDFDQLTSQDCAYCGQPPSRVQRTGAYAGGEFTYNGLDRVDNTLGYVASNVVPCCRICNVAKSDMSYGEFQAWIARLIEHHWFHPELLPSRLLAGGA